MVSRRTLGVITAEVGRADVLRAKCRAREIAVAGFGGKSLQL
jgi:hypothetical protein